MLDVVDELHFSHNSKALTIIITSFSIRPEVDISDESLNDTSCVLNRSRNASLEDKGIQSTDFGTNFDAVRQRPASPKNTSSPMKRHRRRRQKSMIEKGLEKLGLPAMDLGLLFVPLVVIIAVLYVTSPPDVDTTMKIIKSDIEMAESMLPTAEPITVKVESSLPSVVDEIKTILSPDEEIVPTEEEEEIQTALSDKIIDLQQTVGPVVPVDEIDEEIEQKVKLLREDLTADADAKLAEFHAKLESMSRKLDDTKKSDEILEQMKQRIQENDQHIEQLTKRLSEKVSS